METMKEPIKIAPSPAVPVELRRKLVEADPSAESAFQGSPGQLPPKKQKAIGKTAFRLGLLALAILLASVFGYPAVVDMLHTESTDDAFVAAHVHTITARTQGTVMAVLVEDHQLVKPGQLLVKLDPRDYEAQVHIARSRFSKSAKDIARMKQGHTSEAGTAYEDDLEDDPEIGSAAPATSQPNYAPDERKLVDEYSADASQAQGELQRSLLHLEYTSVVAPAAGRIGKRTVETGQVVQPGQALMALVEPNPWINANFKETQLAHIRVGQEATISIDAIPDHKFTGHVESISAASGATYSLLPPDNATGNFTKVVQRVPVKIVFDPESVRGYEERIAAGMSTEISVRVR